MNANSIFILHVNLSDMLYIAFFYYIQYQNESKWQKMAKNYISVVVLCYDIVLPHSLIMNWIYIVIREKKITARKNL